MLFVESYSIMGSVAPKYAVQLLRSAEPVRLPPACLVKLIYTTDGKLISPIWRLQLVSLTGPCAVFIFCGDKNLSHFLLTE